MSEKSQIQLLYAKFTDLENSYKDCFTLLNRHEVDRATQFQCKAAAHRFILSRIKLKEVLSSYTGLAFSKINIVQENNNKPHLGNNDFDWIDFNISHTNDMLVIAIAKDTKVGIDIERVAYNEHIEAITDQYFTQEEREVVIAGVSKGDFRPFYQLWTRREAFLKGIGEGIVWLDQWNHVSFYSNCVINHLSKRKWRVIDVKLSPYHCCSLSYLADLQKVDIQGIRNCAN